MSGKRFDIEMRKTLTQMVFGMSPFALLAGSTVPMRVLVVEDEIIISIGLKELVSSFGHNVVGIARNAKDAVALALRHKPDIILMDVKLGEGRDGIDAAKEILEILDTVVIFCTAYKHDPILAKRMNDLHPKAILQKPFPAADLKRLMQ